jgi:hypothetical protein
MIAVPGFMVCSSFSKIFKSEFDRLFNSGLVTSTLPADEEEEVFIFCDEKEEENQKKSVRFEQYSYDSFVFQIKKVKLMNHFQKI